MTILETWRKEASFIETAQFFNYTKIHTNYRYNNINRIYANKLGPEKVDEFRWHVRTLLDKKSTIGSNLNKEEMAAIQSVKKDTRIKILPADKRNATVVMDIGQIYKVLSEGSYTKVKKITHDKHRKESIPDLKNSLWISANLA